eukprot:3466963-Rhodomonas_salina.1
MCGTSLCYAPTRCAVLRSGMLLRNVRYQPMLCSYAMCVTDLCYAPTRCAVLRSGMLLPAEVAPKTRYVPGIDKLDLR